MTSIRMYRHSNAELIAMMRDRHQIVGDLADAKIDRKQRTMTEPASRREWTIPADWDLT